MIVITKRIAKKLVKERAPYRGNMYNILKYFVEAVHVDEPTDSIEDVKFSRTLGTIAEVVRCDPRTAQASIAKLVTDLRVTVQPEPDTYSLHLQPLLELPTRKTLRRLANRERQRTWYDKHRRDSQIAGTPNA